MTAPILILGGTTEASALASRLANAGLPGIISLAGRVRTPAAQPLPVRIGGFGGVDGLVRYLEAEGIGAVVDATHPFAAQMSTNAVAACRSAEIPLIALTRAPWVQHVSDNWQVVPTLHAAAQALEGDAKRVFLAVGRQHLDVFARLPQHHYLLRVVDEMADAPFPDCTVVTGRGPFSAQADEALLRAHQIDLVVSKNAGGSGAEAKIIAARKLGLPVVMIDRPAVPPRQETHSVDAVVDWLRGHSTDLGA